MNFDVEYFARLARIKLTEAEKARFAKEFAEILAYVEELKSVDTENVVPMTGGTDLRSVYREDKPQIFDDCGKGPESFPEKKDGYLRVPKVFE